jgi:hypothetical protein
MKASLAIAFVGLALLGDTAASATLWSFKPPAKDGPASSFFKAHGWEQQQGSWDNWQFQNGALHTYQDGDSTLVGLPVSIDPGKAPVLKYSFEVKIHPKDADLGKKTKEDSALRIFVIFDRGGGLFTPPDTLAYAFGNPAMKGRMIASERFDNVKYLVVAGGPGQLGKKISIERDLAKDYRQAFGRAAPFIKAIGIKSDGNNLKRKAQAIVYGIEVVAPKW